jgi:ADP-heptose:LPS heptosyltransferase
MTGLPPAQPSAPEPDASPLLQPQRHAATILAWLAARPQAQVAADCASLDLDHAINRAADALGDAADSDDSELRAAGLNALFAGVVEPLNDGFTPGGRALYAHLMARIAWRVASRVPALSAALAELGVHRLDDLVARYRQARRGDAALPGGPVARILVLSRVTIGADILLSSVALERLHQRFPQAELVLLGDAKLDGLFAGLPQVRVRAISYARRGPLRERLASWLEVLAAIRAEAPQLVVAPDSRLDQLGVLPVCAEQERYLLWENLQPAGSPLSLCTLLDRFLCRRLGLPEQPPALPRLGFSGATAALRQRLQAALGGRPLAAVKLDHGGNAAKALPRAGELAVLGRLRELGWRVLLDRGFGPAELANSDALLQALDWQAVDIDEGGAIGLAAGKLVPGALAQAAVVRFHGSISGWAAGCSCAQLAVSYDSVGHHLAAALGVPVVAAFTGFSDPAFPVAWQPRGRSAITVITIATADKERPGSWQQLLATLPPAPR